MSRHLKRPAVEEAGVIDDFATAHDAKRARLNVSKNSGSLVQSHETMVALRPHLRGTLQLFFQQLHHALRFPHLPSELLDLITDYAAVPSLPPVDMPVVTVVVVISWPIGKDRLGISPHVMQFNTEEDFRSYVKHLVLENPTECARWARSFRRIEASFPIKDPDGDASVSVDEIGTGGKYLVTDLTSTDVLTWSEFEDRFIARYAEATQEELPFDLLESYGYDYQSICTVLEDLTDASIPLAETITALQQQQQDTHAIEVFVSEHPAQVNDSEFYPHDDRVKARFAGCVLLH